MAQRGGGDWFKHSRVTTKGGGSLTVRQSNSSTQHPTIVCVDDAPPSLEQSLTRKRKAGGADGSSSVGQKGKKIATARDDLVEERSLPLGMWDPGFDLRHKIEFNFDVAEEKVMAAMSEQ